MVLMQFGLHNLNYTNTNSEHVCNLNSHFKDNTTLLNSHPGADPDIVFWCGKNMKEFMN